MSNLPRCVLLLLVLSFGLDAFGVPPSPAPETDLAAPAEAVLVLQDGGAVGLGAAPWRLDDELLADADHAWVWSIDSPPRRCDPQDLAQPVLRPAERRVALRVPGLSRGQAAAIEVAAAPTAMWGEVPEVLVPHYRLGEDGVAELPATLADRWRLRLIGDGRGSAWVDLPPGSGSATALAAPAEPLALTVLSAAGEPLPEVSVSVLAAQQHGVMVARFVGGEDGRIVIPALPASTSLQLVINQPGHAPQVLAGTPDQLPKSVVLDRGVRLRGRVLHQASKATPVPLADARVTVEAWLADDAGALYRKAATTAADGSWELGPVPYRTAMVEVRSPHLVPWSRRLDLGEGGGSAELSVGDVVLAPGVTVEVVAVDDLDRPVAGARVESGPPTASPSTTDPVASFGGGGAADRRGHFQLAAAAESEPLVVRATAPGYVQAIERLDPPLPEQVRLRMPRAVRLTGRFVDGDGAPILEGSVRVQKGHSFRDEPLASGATFSLELPPATPAELTFTSPRTAAVTVPVPAADPGEILDLGDITPPRGVTVSGSLLASLDGHPVAGARVWVPRRMEGGPLVAWMLGQLVETTSDIDGRFSLSGLDPAPQLLRIDAPGKARLYLPLQPEPQESWLDAGELWLEEGAAVRVLVPGGELGDGHDVARVDLRNRGLEMDMVTAPVYDGVAVVEHLPCGKELTVSVTRGHRLACERRVELPESGESVDVECAGHGLEVSGTVLAGGEPVTGGMLVWSTEASEEGAAIVTTVSSLGLRRQSVSGAGHPPVPVQLDAEGRFVTEELTPGAWRVIWHPPGGGASPEIAVEIPVSEAHVLTLQIPGRTIAGVVLGPRGEPAAVARVRELGTGATTLSRPDGTFRLTGLETDVVELEARLKDLRSPVQSVEMPRDRAAGWVELHLESRPDDALRILVRGAGGEPMAGSLVLLEDDRHNLRLVSADRDGRANVPMLPPAPKRVRMAAIADGAWAFGAWQPWDRDRGEAVLEMGEVGAVVISSDELAGSPVIEGPNGWDVSGALTRVGLRPFVDASDALHLAGLPAGRYQVRLGDARRTLTLEEGAVERVELP